jgi:hypothetical protein
VAYPAATSASGSTSGLALARRARGSGAACPRLGRGERFLADLPYLWAAADPETREMLARALFERIDVLGVEDVRIPPTREALEHGWFEAWQGKTITVPLDPQSLRYGRGERASTG